MKKGVITIFLASLLALILALELVVLESARAAGLKYLERQAGEAAADSVLAGFNRPLFDRYGLLFYEGGCGDAVLRTEVMEAEFSEIYLENRTPGVSLFGGSLFSLESVSAITTDVVTATDYNGAVLIENALAFYPYEAAGALLSLILDELGIFGQGEEFKEATELSHRDDLKGSGISHAVFYGDDAGGQEAPGTEEDTYDRERYDEAIQNSPIGKAEAIKAKGWMSLVMPAGKTIPGLRFELSAFPSKTSEDRRDPEGDTLTNPLKKALFDEYVLTFFSCYTEQKYTDGGSMCEVEYILFGHDSEEANLSAALNRIMWIREAMNILYLYQDQEKRETAFAAAEVLAGWSGLPWLVAVTQAALIASWAYAEALLDARSLIDGKRVPLLKSQDTWTLSLEGVTHFFNGVAVEVPDTENGMSYRDYLRVLLFCEKVSTVAYRTMDMIQYYYSRTNPNFRMANAVQRITFRAAAVISPVFSMLPLVRSLFTGQRSPYVTVNSFSADYGG